MQHMLMQDLLGGDVISGQLHVPTFVYYNVPVLNHFMNISKKTGTADTLRYEPLVRPVQRETACQTNTYVRLIHMHTCT